MQELRANTAVIVHIGPFVDVADGFTPQTDIALACNEAEIQKHGGDDATVDISGNTWAAITNCRGWYRLTLSTTDTNTPGMLEVIVQDDSDALPVFAKFMVISEHAWDLKYGTEGSGGGIKLGKLWYGTFPAVGAATITAGDDTAGNAIYVGARVLVVLDSGTNAVGRARFGTMGATRVITVDPSWGATVPSGTLIGSVWAVPESTTSSLPAVTVPSLAAIIGALDDAAAAGAVTDSDTIVAYVKQAITALLIAVNSDGVTLDTTQGNYAPNVVVPDAAGVVGAILGAVDDAAAAGAVTDSDTVVAYVKQLITAILLGVGTDGVTLATAQGNYAPNVVVPDAAGVAPTAAEIVNEFETQSQADPTGFHVNVMEVNSVDLTGDGDGTPIGAA